MNPERVLAVNRRSRPVLLFVDTFTELYDTVVGQAMYEAGEGAENGAADGNGTTPDQDVVEGEYKVD